MYILYSQNEKFFFRIYCKILFTRVPEWEIFVFSKIFSMTIPSGVNWYWVPLEQCTSRLICTPNRPKLAYSLVFCTENPKVKSFSLSVWSKKIDIFIFKKDTGCFLGRGGNFDVQYQASLSIDIQSQIKRWADYRLLLSLWCEHCLSSCVNHR